MKKIVLAIENGIIALEIKKDLESEGYLVPFITNTLKEVLMDHYEMDLLILDIDFISTERVNEVKVPIIFLTSSEDHGNSTEISTLQVTYDFLYKPFIKEQLLDKTGQILSPDNHNS